MNRNGCAAWWFEVQYTEKFILSKYLNPNCFSPHYTFMEVTSCRHLTRWCNSSQIKSHQSSHWLHIWIGADKRLVWVVLLGLVANSSSAYLKKKHSYFQKMTPGLLKSQKNLFSVPAPLQRCWTREPLSQAQFQKDMPDIFLHYWNK